MEARLAYVDLSTITDEDLLRKMWQQAEDFTRKKEIRAYMYKLREQRLKDFYASNDSSPPYFLMDNASATFGLKKSTVTGSHGDSLVDQSFESFKTKEIRDSESPTRFGNMAAIPSDNSGWQIRTSEEVSEDGKTHTVRSTATTQGTKETDGGRTAFAGKNLETHSEHYDGDERNFVHSKGDQSSTVLVEDSIVEGDDGRRVAGTTRSTTTSVSSSHVVRQQQNGDAGWANKHQHDAVDFGESENRRVTSNTSSSTTTSTSTVRNTSSSTQSTADQQSTEVSEERSAPKELSKDPERVREAFRLAQGAGKVIEREETMVNATTKMITETKRLDDGTTVTTRTYEKIGSIQQDPAVEQEYRMTTSTKTSTTERASRPAESKATADFIRQEKTNQSTTATHRISMDVDAAHDSFARSLRSVSPTGSMRSMRSNVSPDTKPDYMRSTFTSERKVSGFQESDDGRSSRSPSVRKASTTKQEQERRESTTVSSTTTSTDRQESVHHVDGVKGSRKPPLVRSETYEERCRKILGMPNRPADSEEGKVEPKSNGSIFSTYDNTVTTVQQQQATRSELREQRKKIEQEIKSMEIKSVRRTSDTERMEVDLVKMPHSKESSPARKPSTNVLPTPKEASPKLEQEIKSMESKSVRHTSDTERMEVDLVKMSHSKESSPARKPSTNVLPTPKEASPVRKAPSLSKEPKEPSPARKATPPAREASPIKQTPVRTDTSPPKESTTKSKATILVEQKQEGRNISVAEITILPVMEVTESVVRTSKTSKLLTKQSSDTKFDRRTTTAASSRAITNKSSSDFDVKRRAAEMATQGKTRTPATSPDKRRPVEKVVTPAPAKQNHITVAKIKIESPVRKPTGQKTAPVKRAPAAVEPETDPESSKDTGISDNSEVDETVESVIEMAVTGTSCCRHTDRKDSAPVYRTTGVARAGKNYTRSSSDNHLRATNASQNRQQTTSSTKSTTSGTKKVERPVKHVATKTINLSTKPVTTLSTTSTTSTTATDHLDNVVIDIQLAKSSREPTPNKLVPIPVSPDTEDTGKPRYPDAVQEPDDDRRTTPSRISNIPIFEEATNEYVGCEITEVDEHQQQQEEELIATQHATRITNLDRVTEDDESLLSVTEKVSKFVQEARRLQEPVAVGGAQPARFAQRPEYDDLDEHLKSDECLLSVSDKVTKFISTAEEVKKIRTSGPFVPESEPGSQVTEDDECLLSVNEKVSRFANRISRTVEPEEQSPGPVPVEPVGRFVPQKSPELVKNAMRSTARHTLEEEDSAATEELMRTNIADRYRTTTVQKQPSSPITLRSTEAVKKAKEIFEKGQAVPQDARQRDILNRPSVWDDRRSKQQQQQQQQQQNEVKLTDIGVYERTKTTAQTVREEQTATQDVTARRKESLTKVEKSKPEPEAPKGARRDSGGGVRAPAYIRDTVSSKKDLFEKRISSSKLQVEYTTQTSQEATESVTSTSVARKSSLKQQPQPEPVSRPSVDGSKPSYMNHTVASLEHINANQRRDSLDHAGGLIVTNEPVVKTGSSKFGVELKRLDTGTRTTAATTAPTATTKRKVSAGETGGQPTGSTPVIEEIFDLEVLERMLESVTGYEQRRRIRAQIRVVKKQKESQTTSASVVTTAKSVTTSTYSTAMARDTNTAKRKDSSPTRGQVQAARKQSTTSSTTAADATDALETPTTNDIKQRQQESTRTTTTKVTTVANDRFSTKAAGGDRPGPTKDDRPIWATSNILKKASENTRTFKSSSATTTSTTGSSPMGRKVVSSSSSTSTSYHQQTKGTSDPKTTTDCITSSYGVGPTDENGLPLFGIRALKKKPAPVVEPDANATTITGTIMTETLYAENGGPTVGKRSTTHYSNEPGFNRENRTGGLMAIRKTETIDAAGAHTEELEVLDGETGRNRTEAKVVRKGSVKELTERFIHRESSGSLTQDSRTYPKAGLILRSSAQSQSSRASTPTATDGGCSVRSGSVDEFEQEQQEQVQVRTFLNDTSKVVDVRDVLQRMSNADNVTERGDTTEDQEARALLNKFLGASVLMSGVESMLSEAGAAPSATSAAATTKKVSKVSSTTSTTKTIKSSGAAPTSSSTKQVSIDNLDENWDEALLKQLLDSTTNYDDRRKIRARIRQVMAEKEVQQTTTTRTTARMESQDGAAVTTRTTVTTKTVASSAPKPMSPFAKFRQLDKQNSLSSQSPPNSPKTPTTPTTPSAAMGPMFKFTDPALNRRAATVKDQLLQWCQMKTKEYENVKIENFSTSWSDGMAFCALIHHFLPDAFDFSKLTPQQRRHNFTLAFRVADEKAGIAPLLDVDDMVAMRKPDWKCVFTYVQSIYRRFKNEL